MHDRPSRAYKNLEALLCTYLPILICSFRIESKRWKRNLIWSYFRRCLTNPWFYLRINSAGHLIMVRILCFIFSLNPLRFFSHERHHNDKSQKLSNFSKRQFLNNKNSNFILPSSIWIFLYKFTCYLQLLSFWLYSFFVSFSCERKSERLERKIKHKIRSQVKSFKLNARKAAYKVTLVGFIYTFSSLFF